MSRSQLLQGDFRDLCSSLPENSIDDSPLNRKKFNESMIQKFGDKAKPILRELWKERCLRTDVFGTTITYKGILRMTGGGSK